MIFSPTQSKIIPDAIDETGPSIFLIMARTRPLNEQNLIKYNYTDSNS